jgi:hypothetical protein
MVHAPVERPLERVRRVVEHRQQRDAVERIRRVGRDAGGASIVADQSIVMQSCALVPPGAMRAGQCAIHGTRCRLR